MWKHGDNMPVWITQLQTTKTESLIHPSDLPTKEEFNKFLDAARHPRDKALIAVCADGGLRIGALLSCKVGSVDLTKHGAYYIIKGGHK